jgi:hypothetical protein
MITPTTQYPHYRTPLTSLNTLTPNDPYSGRTAPLTSESCSLNIYSINIGSEYFKHGIYSPFFSLQNAVCFIILTYVVPVLFTFYIQEVLKLKKNSGAKRIIKPTDDEISPSLHNPHKSYKHQYSFGSKPDDCRNRPKHVAVIIP